MSRMDRRLVDEAASAAERETGTDLTATPSGKVHAGRETESIKKIYSWSSSAKIMAFNNSRANLPYPRRFNQHDASTPIFMNMSE